VFRGFDSKRGVLGFCSNLVLQSFSFTRVAGNAHECSQNSRDCNIFDVVRLFVFCLFSKQWNPFTKREGAFIVASNNSIGKKTLKDNIDNDAAALRNIAFAFSKMNELALDQTVINNKNDKQQSMYLALREVSLFTQCTMINVNCEALGWNDIRSAILVFLEAKNYSCSAVNELLNNTVPCVVSRLDSNHDGYLETLSGFNFWFLVHPEIRSKVVRGFASKNYYKMLIDVFEHLRYKTGIYINVDEVFEGRVSLVEVHQLLVIASYELSSNKSKRSFLAPMKPLKKETMN